MEQAYILKLNNIMGEITDVLAELLVMLKDGLVMAQGEIPALVKDFISWGIVSESTDVVIIMVIVGGLLMLANKFNSNYSFFDTLKKKLEKEDSDSYWRDIRNVTEESSAWIISKYIAYIAAFIFIMVLIGEIMDVVKILVAPRIYLIETITDLLKPAVVR